MSEQTQRRSRTVMRVLTWAAVLWAALIVLDNLTYWLLAPGCIRGTDYLFLCVPGVFLIACLAARRAAGKLSVTFLVTALLVLALEVVMMALSGAGGGRDFAWYVWPPNSRVLLRPHNLVGVSSRGTFTTNARGIRGPEFADDDAARILCLGGSTTECLYLDDSKTWPRLLNDLLAERTPGVWVGNVGRSGQTVLDNAVVAEHLPEARVVDCWVVMAGLNDLGHRLSGEYEDHAERTWTRAFSYRRPGLGRPYRRPYHRNLRFYRMLEALRMWVKVILQHGRGAAAYQDVQAEWIEDRRKLRESSAMRRTLPDLGDYLDGYEADLMRLIRCARRADKTLVMATQPSMWSDHMTPDQRRLCLGVQSPDGEYFDFGELARGLDRFNRRLSEVCRREDVVCVDLAGQLPKTQQVHYDDAHFNENGARLVAERLAEALAPMVDRARTRRSRARTGDRPLTDDRAAADCASLNRRSCSRLRRSSARSSRCRLR